MCSTELWRAFLVGWRRWRAERRARAAVDAMGPLAVVDRMRESWK